MEQQNLNFQMHREVLAKISGGVTTSTVFDFEETFFPFKKKKILIIPGGSEYFT